MKSGRTNRLAPWACALTLAGTILGCGSAGVVADWELSSELVRHVPAADEVTLHAARAALEGGRPSEASALLIPLLAAHPDCVVGAILLQEAKIAALPHSQAAPDALPLTEPDERAKLATLALERSIATGSAVDVLLAARLERDSSAAVRMLQGLLEDPIDADSSLLAWANYALAYHAVLSGDLNKAREGLGAALQAEPGHLHARLLEAKLSSGGTERSDAEALLAHWLERAADAPEVASDEWYAGAVDLAILRVRRSDGAGALEALEALDYNRGAGGEPWGAARLAERVRGGLVRAAALASDGDYEQALVVADATLAMAQEVSLALPLGQMQRGMLLERWLNDPEQAAAAWASALDIISEEVQTGSAVGEELNDLLRAIQAQVRLERLVEQGHLAL